jgi:hypothetical protein
MKQITLALILVVLTADACLAQGFGNECSPAGTWYGGSAPAKYLFTVMPSRAGVFTTLGQAAFKPNPAAVAVLTNYSGTMTAEEGTGRYIGHAIAIANPTDAPPNPATPSYPPVWAVEEYFTLTDCNTLSSVITFFGGYNWLSLEPLVPGVKPKVPFLDPPDFIRNGIPPGTATESYHRVPSTCKRPDVCPIFPVQ